MLRGQPLSTREKNSNLHKAKKAKNDEFYTQLSDIERELKHYKGHFRDKVVYCNCDDHESSNFFRYFSLKFEELGLKRLISSCYVPDGNGRSSYLVYEGDKNGNNMPDPEEIETVQLLGNGDFRSPESTELLLQADIVVTNPPFSLFREYIAQLIAYDKKFLIVGNQNAITYKEIFPLIRDGKLWLGHGFQAGNAYFKTPYTDGYAKGVYDPQTGLVKFRNACWFTNLDHGKRHEPLILYRDYDPGDYPKYDNYDAIEVSRVKNIPKDYYGVMGVPITFLDKFCPEQFEILGLDRYIEDNPNYGRRFRIDKKEKYARILIRRKQ